MNAISITMVKGLASRRRHNLAIQLTALMVVSSWLGCQLLLVSGCYFNEDLRDSVIGFVEAGLIMLFFSLYMLLCLKRLDATPDKESAQLFFGVFLLLLPLLACMDWMYISNCLDFMASLKKTTGVGQAIKYASAFASLIYFVVCLMWVRTVVPYYEQAKPGSMPWCAMRRLTALFVTPYSKE
jgi:hypothetical protein